MAGNISVAVTQCAGSPEVKQEYLECLQEGNYFDAADYNDEEVCQRFLDRFSIANNCQIDICGVDTCDVRGDLEVIVDVINDSFGCTLTFDSLCASTFVPVFFGTSVSIFVMTFIVTFIYEKLCYKGEKQASMSSKS